MKIIKINTCNECNYYKGFNTGSITSKDFCFHQNVMNGVLGKEIEILGNNSLDIPIPKWCPLEEIID